MTQFQTYAQDLPGKKYELAKELNISQPYFSLLLAGKKTPSLELAIRIEKWSAGAVPVASWVEPAAAE